MADRVLAILSQCKCSSAIEINEIILQRPPFSFLHKLVLSLLGSLHLFDTSHTLLQNFINKEMKATFLTRALAWVNFALTEQSTKTGGKYVNILLLVSPTRVLAGIDVENTLEFLFQLGTAYLTIPTYSQNQAVQKVLSIGDAELYTFAVNCRKGITKAQACARGTLARTSISSKEKVDLVGKQFFQEFDGFGVYKGIVQTYDTTTKQYTVCYPEDGDEEDVTESELLHLIAVSQDRFPGPIGTENVYTGRTARGEESPELGVYEEDHIDETILYSNAACSWQTKMKALLHTGRNEDFENATKLRELAMSRPHSRIYYQRSAQPSIPDILLPGGKGEWQKRCKVQSTVTSFSPAKGNAITSPTHASPTHASPTRTAPRQKRTGKSKQNSSKKKTEKKIDEKIERSKSNLERNNSLMQEEKEKSLKRLAAKRSSVTYHRKSFSLLPSMFGVEEGREVEKTVKVLIADITEKLELHLKRKRMRVQDLFRFIDPDGNGSITQQEMVTALAQLDITLSIANAARFIKYIDKDGNGTIEIEELEQFLRLSRRLATRKEQLSKELSTPAREHFKGEKALLQDLRKHKRRLLDACSILDVHHEGVISPAQFRSATDRLALKLLSPNAIDLLIKKTSLEDGNISIETLKVVLQPNTNKNNKYLDHKWLNHFDKRLEGILK